jgi:hypothetical protein
MKQVPTEPMLGADPEGFLRLRRTRQYVPCVGILPGTKYKPAPLGIGKGYAVQEDNVMAEFNIPPQTSVESFDSAIRKAVSSIDEILEKQNLELTFKPRIGFTREQLDSPQARLFGCDPDYDAYSGGTMRPTDQRPDFGYYRAAAGHVHIGCTPNCPQFVVAMLADAVFTSMEDRYITRDGLWRRKWYGAPGIYRPKPYGIEYRSLSNMWVPRPWRRREVARRGLALARFVTYNDAARIMEVYKKLPWDVLHGRGAKSLPERDIIEIEKILINEGVM